MLIHRAGPHIALYIDGAEVSANGWGELDEARLRSLAEEAMGQLGLAAPPRVIEAFPAADGGALVFVRFRETNASCKAIGACDPGEDRNASGLCCIGTEQRETFYAFDGADALLDALRACGIPTQAAGIYRYNGQYILAVTGSGAAFQAVSARLPEFGVRLRAGVLARAMLEEHGLQAS